MKKDLDDVISEIRNHLSLLANEQTKMSGERFFKEKVVLYGVKTGLVQNMAKNYLNELKTLSKTEIFALCEELWKSGVMEEAFIACNWSNALSKKYEPNDFSVFENWVNKYISNWATCDTFCNHSMGSFISKYLQYINNLKHWAKSDNRWVKRASAVTFIIPARKGFFLKDIFELADILLLDKDDMVQKGYGWMLKAASQAFPKEVFDFVCERKAFMPRTALRYAIEKLPAEWKAIAMKK